MVEAGTRTHEPTAGVMTVAGPAATAQRGAKLAELVESDLTVLG